jgi:xanthine dehydrogenase accessory factor
MRTPSVHSLPSLVEWAAAQPASDWAMATLVRVEGSSYRRVGARLLVSDRGASGGVLSGGCLEEEITRLAMELFKPGSGEARLVTFDTRLLYGCHGRIDVLIERLGASDSSDHLLAALRDGLRQRRTLHVQTVYAGDGPLGSTLVTNTATAEPPDHALVESITPAIRLLAFGAGPEIEPLRHFSAGLGWQMETFAQPHEFPARFAPDEQTVAIVMNHHVGRDCASLERLIPLGLPYVGLLGPRARRTEILRILEDHIGFDNEWMNAIHAPAGLDIGGDRPEEIALSILAEACAVLHSRHGGSLRDRRFPIHERALPAALPA